MFKNDIKKSVQILYVDLPKVGYKKFWMNYRLTVYIRDKKDHKTGNEGKYDKPCWKY
jgi:hypothetical protein